MRRSTKSAASAGEAVVHPTRVIAGLIAPRRAVEVRGLARERHLRHTEGLEDETAQGGIEALPHLVLDQAAHEEITDVGVGPAAPRREEEPVGNDPAQELLDAPGRISPA